MYNSIIIPTTDINYIKEEVRKHIKKYNDSEYAIKYKEAKDQYKECISSQNIFNTLSAICGKLLLITLMFLILAGFLSSKGVNTYKTKAIICLIIFLVFLISTIIFILLSHKYYMKSFYYSAKMDKYKKMNNEFKKCLSLDYCSIFDNDSFKFNKHIQSILDSITTLSKWAKIYDITDANFDCNKTNKYIVCTLYINNKKEDKLKISNKFFSIEDYAELIKNRNRLNFRFIDRFLLNYITLLNSYDFKEQNDEDA